MLKIRIIKAIVFLSILGAILFYSANYYINLHIDRPLIRKTLNKHIRMLTDRAYNIGQIRFSLLEGVIVEDIDISLDKDFNQGTYLLKIPKFVFSFNIQDFLNKKFKPKRISIVEPKVFFNARKNIRIWKKFIKSVWKIADHKELKGVKFFIENSTFSFKKGDSSSLINVKWNVKGDFYKKNEAKIISTFDFIQIKNKEKIKGRIISRGEFRVFKKEKIKKRKIIVYKKKKNKSANQKKDSHFLLELENNIDNVPMAVILAVNASGINKDWDYKFNLNGKVKTSWNNKEFKLNGILNTKNITVKKEGHKIISSLSLNAKIKYTLEPGKDKLKYFSLVLYKSPLDFSMKLENLVGGKIFTLSRKKVPSGQLLLHIKDFGKLKDFVVPLKNTKLKGSFLAKVSFKRSFSYTNPLNLNTEISLNNFKLTKTFISKIKNEKSNEKKIKKIWSIPNFSFKIQKEKIYSNLKLNFPETELNYQMEGKIKFTGTTISSHYGSSIIAVRRNTKFQLNASKFQVNNFSFVYYLIHNYLNKYIKKQELEAKNEILFSYKPFYNRWVLASRTKGDVNIDKLYWGKKFLGKFNMQSSLKDSVYTLRIKNTLNKNENLSSYLSYAMQGQSPALSGQLKLKKFPGTFLIKKLGISKQKVEDISADLKFSSYGDRLSELINKIDINGKITLNNIHLKKTPFQNSLFLEKVKLRNYPELVNNEELHFNTLFFYLSYTNAEGKLTYLDLIGEPYSFKGNCTFNKLKLILRLNGSRKAYENEKLKIKNLAMKFYVNRTLKDYSDITLQNLSHN